MIKEFKKEMLNEGVVPIFVAYKLINLLSSDFKDWEAYKKGIIDEDGNTIRKPISSAEKNSFGIFEKIIRKVKQLLGKVIGSSRAAAILSTLYFLKEYSSFGAYNVVLKYFYQNDEDFKKYLDEYTYNFENEEIIKAGNYKSEYLEEEISLEEDVEPIEILHGIFPIYEVDNMYIMKEMLIKKEEVNACSNN